MVSGGPPSPKGFGAATRFRVSVIKGQRSDDRRQIKNVQDEATFLYSVIRLLTPKTKKE
jgi:hypothetical protein